jgi:hypothetical protein
MGSRAILAGIGSSQRMHRISATGRICASSLAKSQFRCCTDGQRLASPPLPAWLSGGAQGIAVYERWRRERTDCYQRQRLRDKPRNREPIRRGVIIAVTPLLGG